MGKTRKAQFDCDGQAVSGGTAILALLLAVYALFAARLDRFSVSPAIAFVAIGLLLSDDALGLIAFEPAAEAVRLLAELALTLLLFADASSVRRRALRHDVGPIVRLLLVGLPLTIVLGTLSAAFLFPGIPLGVALLIGASLAPTDAALGQAVVTNRAVPPRVRRLLNVESGLNDGIATPFVFLALGLATAEASGYSGWLADALIDFGIGAGAGVVLGLVGGWSLRMAVERGWASGASSQLFALALAASCYLVASAVGGNGFIAAFVGGLAFGVGSGHRESQAVEFTETQGSLLAIGVWSAFGLLLAGHLQTDLWNVNAIVYAVLSLTIVRMLPVAIALVGARFHPGTVLFVGWFGPRGLASIVFLIIGFEGLREAGIDTGPLVGALAWTVLLSVILHGLSAGPLARRYGRMARRLPATAPELADTVEPTPGRLAWASDRHRQTQPTAG